jgi:hypothetical protein
MISELKTIPAGQFDAIDESSLMVDPNSGKARGGPSTGPPPTGPPPGPPYPGVTTPLHDWYFAEGTTRSGFQEYLSILNPTLTANATVAVDYQFSIGSPLTTLHTVLAGTRLTLDVNQETGVGKDVSARVRVTGGPGVVVDRPMYFRSNVAALDVKGGHVAAGVETPRTTWYFAEGTTRGGFQEYLTIANTSPTDTALVRVDYQGAVGAQSVLTVGPSTRSTVDVNREVGGGRDVAAIVQVLQGPGVVAERPLYIHADLGLSSAVIDGTTSPGAPAPAKDWYFAEGTTRTGFREFLTVQNPSASQPSTIHVDYQGAPGAASDLTVAPGTRATIDVNAAVGPERDVSAALHVTAGAGVVAERPMYFLRPLVAGQTVNGGHDALGALGPSTIWIFAEGTTRSGFQEYLTLQNPSLARPATVAVYYRFAADQGAPLSALYDVPPASRLTVDVLAEAGAGKDVSIVVIAPADRPVVAERPMYFVTTVAGLLVDG